MPKNKAQSAKSEKVAAQPATTESTVQYVATDKATKPDTFFAKVQAAASKPITLSALIAQLTADHTREVEPDKALVPKSRKAHAMVIRVRTNYAANHGFLKAVKQVA